MAFFNSAQPVAMIRSGLLKRETKAVRATYGGRDEDAALAEVDALGFVAVKIFEPVAAIAAQWDAELFVEAVDRVRGAVQRHVQPGVGEDFRQLLRLSQRVTHDDGLAILSKGGFAQLDKLGGNLLARGELEMGEPVGRFHDEEVRGFRVGAVGGEASAELEVTGIEQRPLVARDVHHRAPQDVAGGEQLDARRFAGDIVVHVVGRLGDATQPDAMLRHRGRGGRSDRALVHADMVAVRMADHTQRPRLAAVEVDAGAFDFEVVGPLKHVAES
jgi:hypothetical protein